MDDYRFVATVTTNEEGYASNTVEHKYHYDKTFCDGHPAPAFVESRKRKKMRKEKLQIRTKLMKQRKKTEDLQVAGWNVLMRVTKLHLQVPMRESTFIG